MCNRANKERSFLELLQHAENTQKKALLKTASDEQVRILSEIVYNILGGVIEISAKSKQDLLPHKNKLRKLGDKTQTYCALKRMWNKFPLEILKTIIKAGVIYLDRAL